MMKRKILWIIGGLAVCLFIYKAGEYIAVSQHGGHMPSDNFETYSEYSIPHTQSFFWPVFMAAILAIWVVISWELMKWCYRVTENPVMVVLLFLSPFVILPVLAIKSVKDEEKEEKVSLITEQDQQ